MWLLILLVLWPIVEIALFIEIGSEIGVAATILWVVLSAMIGIWAMRLQGMAAMVDLQRAVDDFRDPGRPLAHGALAMIGGGLLVLPGFFTDALGILLLIPPVRSALLGLLGRRVRASAAASARGTRPGWPPEQPHRPPVIDAEYVVVEETDEDVPPPDYDHPDAGPTPPQGPGGRRGPPSGWTRH